MCVYINERRCCSVKILDGLAYIRVMLGRYEKMKIALIVLLKISDETQKQFAIRMHRLQSMVKSVNNHEHIALALSHQVAHYVTEFVKFREGPHLPVVLRNLAYICWYRSGNRDHLPDQRAQHVF